VARQGHPGPAALALLLTIAPSRWWPGWSGAGVPRIAAVLLVLALVVGLLGGAAYVVVTQALALAATCRSTRPRCARSWSG
jgi:predicted PurR-regulated permease PerM